MQDLRHADEGVEVEEDCQWVEDVGEDYPGRLPEHLDLILLCLRVFQQETGKTRKRPGRMRTVRLEAIPASVSVVTSRCYSWEIPNSNVQMGCTLPGLS